MLLGKSELEKLISEHGLVQPYEASLVKSVHVDLRLSENIARYSGPVDLKQSSELENLKINSDEGCELNPGDFIIGTTEEVVHIPQGYWGFIETKGNIARAGLSSHNTDGHIDPGYRGVITLEIKNMNTVPVKIYPGATFVQLFVFEVKGDAPLYEGKYQDSTKPTPYIHD